MRGRQAGEHARVQAAAPVMVIMIMMAREEGECSDFRCLQGLGRGIGRCRSSKMAAILCTAGVLQSLGLGIYPYRATDFEFFLFQSFRGRGRGFR